MCVMDNQNIETPRLLLRRWKRGDHRPFAALCADPEVMRYIGDGSTLTPREVAYEIVSYEVEWKETGAGPFAVELKQTGKCIGYTGFFRPTFLPEISPSIEIGWRLSKESWGNGYGSEAASAALSYGVNNLGLWDIVSIYQLENVASERIMQKLGMVFDRKTITPESRREIGVYRLPKPALT